MSQKKSLFISIMAIVAITPAVLATWYFTGGERGSISALIITAIAVTVPALAAIIVGKSRGDRC